MTEVAVRVFVWFDDNHLPGLSAIMYLTEDIAWWSEIIIWRNRYEHGFNSIFNNNLGWKETKERQKIETKVELCVGEKRGPQMSFFIFILYIQLLP